MSYQAHWGTHTVIPGSSGVQAHPYSHIHAGSPGYKGHPYSHTWRLTRVQRSPTVIHGGSPGYKGHPQSYVEAHQGTKVTHTVIHAGSPGVQRSPTQSYMQTHRGYKGRCDLFGLHLLPIQHLEEGMSHGCIEELETFILVRVEKLWEGGGGGNGNIIRVQSSTRFRGCAHV